jgi:hypothetical protein
MKKKHALKIGCFAGIAVLVLAILLLFPQPAYYLGFEDGNDRTEEYRNAKQLTLKEMPQQLTAADWESAGVVSYDYAGHISSADGEIVPFRVKGKKAAYRAAMACAGMMELDTDCTLRYSPSQTYIYQAISPALLGWKYYAFVQFYHDIPVWNSTVVIRTERFGKPAQLMCNLVHGFSADLPAEPKLTADEAKRVFAKEKLEEPSKTAAPLLAYTAGADGAPVLAWVIQNDFGESAPVNALTGEILPDPGALDLPPDLQFNSEEKES